MKREESRVKDMSLADVGKLKIEWAEEHIDRKSVV